MREALVDAEQQRERRDHEDAAADAEEPGEETREQTDGDDQRLEACAAPSHTVTP